MVVKNKLLSQSMGEDEKNWKNYYVGKIMPCKFFQVSLKKIEFHTSPCVRKIGQKIRIFWCNSSYFTQNFVIKLEKIDMASLDFKCNLQQYSLFSKVPVCTKNLKDIDEPEFFVLS